jgi:cobalt-zinc-cadmium efflux system membrane fusion protein
MELKWEKPGQQAIAEKLMLKGKIDVPPQNLVSVSAPLGGYLKASHLLPGMHVKKGERLATLEDKLFVDMQEEYLSQNIKLSLLGMDSERQKALYAQKAASEKTMQEAVSAYQQQVVLVNALKEKLRLINIDPKRLKPETISRSIDIYSPIDGYVSNVQTNVGKYVQPSDVLFELVNPSDIHLNLTVYEKDIPRLHIGQNVSTYSNNDTTKKYPAQIILIGKDVSAERFVEVHCHFERYDNQLLPGMYMNAHVELDGTKGLVVPNEAIQRFEGREYIFVRRTNQQFEMLEVKRIANNGQSSSLSSPQLNPNLEIVTKGAYTLLMKLKNTEAE